MNEMIVRLLNEIRNILMFRIRYPWVRHGRDIHCQFSTTFWSPRRHIVLGNYVGVGYRRIFQSDAEIGNKVMIASDVAFINSDDHLFDVIGKMMWDSERGDKYKIVIEDDVWIGHGVIILSPACIGRGAIVAAGSVVTSDVPRYAIFAGVPARNIRMRFMPEQIMEHEAMLIQKGEIMPEDRTIIN
jgi:acetyltransferase-like isoleucine patch superfamily enzyme